MKANLSNQPTPNVQLITCEDLAERWKTSRMTIWRKRRDGVLPFYRLGPRTVRFRLDDVLQYEAAAAS